MYVNADMFRWKHIRKALYIYQCYPGTFPVADNRQIIGLQRSALMRVFWDRTCTWVVIVVIVIFVRKKLQHQFDDVTARLESDGGRATCSEAAVNALLVMAGVRVYPVFEVTDLQRKLPIVLNPDNLRQCQCLGQVLRFKAEGHERIKDRKYRTSVMQLAVHTWRQLHLTDTSAHTRQHAEHTADSARRTSRL